MGKWVTDTTVVRSVRLLECVCVRLSPFCWRLGRGRGVYDGLCSSVTFFNDFTQCEIHLRAHTHTLHYKMPLSHHPQLPLLSTVSISRYEARHPRDSAASVKTHSDMLQKSNESASIAALLMEIQPGRCGLLEEHVECKTGLCVHTQVPVATVCSATRG